MIYSRNKEKRKDRSGKTQNYDKNNLSKKIILNMKLVLCSQIMEILIGKLMKHILKQIKLLKLYLMI